MKIEFIELLRELVRFQSTKDRIDEKKKIVNYVNNWFTKREIKTQIFEHESCPSIIATLPGTIDKTIIFSAHLDVVHADESAFTMTQEDHILFGRGTSDDKGQAALSMLLINEIKELSEYPTIKVVLTTDEEIGGFNGVQRLVNEGHLHADAVLVFDYGCDENEIAVQEKGGITFKLKAPGVPAHASRLWKGQNAIYKLIRNCLAIQKEFDHSDQAPEYWGPTCNLGVIKGGESSNQVPDYAEATLDIRFATGYSSKKILNKVKELIDDDVEIEPIIDIPYFESDPENPFIKKYIETVGKSLGKEVNITKMYGATDARHWAGTGIPVWLASPHNGGHHSKKEWIDVDSTVRFFHAIIEYIKNIK